jgi:hypothetical protein
MRIEVRIAWAGRPQRQRLPDVARNPLERRHHENRRS